MRVPKSLAWILVVLAFFTSGLLRQFHDATPRSPWLHPVVGNLLFAAVFLLLLVAAREWRAGSVRGAGVRLGSLTPLLLMLLLEKWVALSLYAPVFGLVADERDPPAILDAQFRALAGVGLLVVCALVGRFSTPALRKTWRRVRPARWPPAALSVALVVGATYAALAAAAWLGGGPVRLVVPRQGALLGWMLAGQALLALAEEVYFRGLLLSETERLAPRLGVRNAAGRRWVALGLTGLLFGLEHAGASASPLEAARLLVFTVSLGVLLGMIVMVAANLHLAAGLHAWINWLLLGAAPRLVHADGSSALPSGAYIGLALVLAFAVVYVRHRWRHGRAGEPS